MGDALSSAVPFDYLLKEVVDVAMSPLGQRHLWLWLSKRPGRMAQFGKWLHSEGVEWPANLVAMTSVLDRRMAKTAVDQLRKAPAKIRGLGVEPLWESVELDLEGIDWVIVGGESGSHPKPFDLQWARSLKKQCRSEEVAIFVKQLGRHPIEKGGLSGCPTSMEVTGMNRHGIFGFVKCQMRFAGGIGGPLMNPIVPGAFSTYRLNGSFRID